MLNKVSGTSKHVIQTVAPVGWLGDELLQPEGIQETPEVNLKFIRHEINIGITADKNFMLRFGAFR